MDPWPFVIGSYVVGGVGTIGLVVQSILAMRRAEKAADELSKNR